MFCHSNSKIRKEKHSTTKMSQQVQGGAINGESSTRTENMGKIFIVLKQNRWGKKFDNLMMCDTMCACIFYRFALASDSEVWSHQRQPFIFSRKKYTHIRMQESSTALRKLLIISILLFRQPREKNCSCSNNNCVTKWQKQQVEKSTISSTDSTASKWSA